MQSLRNGLDFKVVANPLKKSFILVSKSTNNLAECVLLWPDYLHKFGKDGSEILYQKFQIALVEVSN